jgi:hypothetical protein
VHTLLPESRIEFAGNGDPDPRSYRVDFGKLGRTFPSFRMRWTARDGAAQLLEAFQEQGLTLAVFEGERYVRLRRLRQLLAEGVLDDDLRWRHEQPAAASR